MNDKPRKHHFVPQFWIRRFAGTDGKLWAYDHDNGRISERWPAANGSFREIGSAA